MRKGKRDEVKILRQDKTEVAIRRAIGTCDHSQQGGEDGRVAVVIWRSTSDDVGELKVEVLCVSK